MIAPVSVNYLILYAALLAAPVAWATPDTNAQVESSARTHLTEAAQRFHLVAPRITLKAVAASRKPLICTQPVDIKAIDTRHFARMKFRVSCAADWQETYIVRAEITALTVVAAAPLHAGQRITDNDLQLDRRSLGPLENALFEPSEAIGQASRRALRAGQILDRRMLSPAVLVHRGAAVRIVAQNAGISVTTAGQARKSGKLDDIIEVRNAVTGKFIRARITGENQVEPTDISTSQRPD